MIQLNYCFVVNPKLIIMSISAKLLTLDLLILIFLELNPFAVLFGYRQLVHQFIGQIKMRFNVVKEILQIRMDLAYCSRSHYFDFLLTDGEQLYM